LKELRTFDVFDTCLTRRVGVPSALFYEVAQKTFARLGIPSSKQLLEDFVAARIEAERIARMQASSEDITLDDIWSVLTHSMGWQLDTTLSFCELQAEEASLVPIVAARKLVQSSRRQGHRIVFVSDMYLPTEFIRRLLTIHGFAEDGDGLYVSGEIGKMKATGNLFNHLLVQEKVVATQIQHIGDNQHSDYAVPSKLGIRAELFRDSQFTDTELRLLQRSMNLPAAAKLAGAMRSFRLGRDDSDENLTALAAQFTGPFVMGFAVWALQQAQAKGIKRLYFLSRDCQLVWKVARELAPQFGNIDCRYLYVSRQALYLPSATGISPEGMPWMRRPFEEPILKNLLAKIELKFQDVPTLGELAGNQGEAFCLKSEQDWLEFWHALNEESVKERVDKLITLRREDARLFYESQGLFDPEPWAIVDLGWYLTGQQALWKMLKVFGWEKQMQGFYLALRHGRVGREGAGAADALIYEPPSSFQTQNLSSTIFACQTLLEHIIGCADHPTVHHYEMKDQNPGPLFVNPMEETAVMFCQKMHNEVLAYTMQNSALVEEFKDAVFCRDMLASLVASFFQHPNGKAVSALLGLTIAIDQNGLDSLPIVDSLTLREVLKPDLPPWIPFNQAPKVSAYHWREGSLAITPQSTIQSARMIQRFIKFGNKWISRWHRLTTKIAIRSRLRRLLQSKQVCKD
jgi:predicted HAD superfamily hydrolase